MRILLVALAFTTSLYLYAQSLPDSISTEIQAMEIDSNKVNRLNDLSRNYWRNDISLAHQLATNALDLSKEIQFENGICRSLNYLGIVYTNKSNFDSARYYLDEAYKLALKLNHKKYQYAILNSQGIVERKAGNFENATKAYLKALEFAEQIGTDAQVASILMNIGNIYFDLDNFSKASSFYERSLNKFEEMGHPAGVGHLLNNLGNLYFESGNTTKSLEYFELSLEHKQKHQNVRGLGTTHVNIGLLYNEIDSLYLAKFHFNEAIKLYQTAGTFNDVVHAYLGLSGFNLNTGNIKLAESQAKKALEIAEKSSMKEELKDSHNKLAKIYDVLGFHEQALDHHVTYSQIKDSLFQQDVAKTISDLEIKYETEKKEREIIEANAEIERKERFQTFLFVLIGLVVLFSSIAILMITQRYRLRKALLSQEIDTLRAQINALFGGGVKNLDLSLEQINDGLHKPLSEREYEILSHAISDQTNGEIAEAVFVSVNTVKTHLKNVYTKLGVSNRKEALEILLAKA